MNLRHFFFTKRKAVLTGNNGGLEHNYVTRAISNGKLNGPGFSHPFPVSFIVELLCFLLHHGKNALCSSFKTMDLKTLIPAIADFNERDVQTSVIYNAGGELYLTIFTMI